MTIAVTRAQALAWRMRRQGIEPIGSGSVHEVVRRLGGVQAQVASSADLAIRLRRTGSTPGDVAATLAEGTLIKTWAMRGSLHLLTPEEAGTFLSVMASGRTWERPSWQRYFGVSPAEIEALRGVVRTALDGPPLTREELIAAVTATSGFEHLGTALGSGWGTLLKPLAWQGDLCFGPTQGARVTFTRPEAASRHWTPLPDPDDAGPRVITTYLGAYGPATPEAFGGWMAGGFLGQRRLKAWFAALGTALTEVEVDGRRAFVLTADVDALVATEPSDSVRLLGGFDVYVLGPGTADEHVIAGARRSAVSRQAGWISPIVLVGGAVAGTWALDGDALTIDWFREGGSAPKAALAAEVRRLGDVLGRPLRMTIVHG